MDGVEAGVRAGPARQRRSVPSVARRSDNVEAQKPARVQVTRESSAHGPAWYTTEVSARGHTLETVEAIGRTLADVGVTTAWGQPALKVRGKMFVCIASHKSAEPNSLVVMMEFAARDALVEDDPGTYYLKEHYLNYPCVLVRLSRVHSDALRDLVTSAHRFVSAKTRSKSGGGSRHRGPTRRSPDRR